MKQENKTIGNKKSRNEMKRETNEKGQRERIN